MILDLTSVSPENQQTFFVDLMQQINEQYDQDDYFTEQEIAQIKLSLNSPTFSGFTPEAQVALTRVTGIQFNEQKLDIPAEAIDKLGLAKVNWIGWSLARLDNEKADKDRIHTAYSGFYRGGDATLYQATLDNNEIVFNQKQPNILNFYFQSNQSVQPSSVYIAIEQDTLTYQSDASNGKQSLTPEEFASLNISDTNLARLRDKDLTGLASYREALIAIILQRDHLPAELPDDLTATVRLRLRPVSLTEATALLSNVSSNSATPTSSSSSPSNSTIYLGNLSTSPVKQFSLKVPVKDLYEPNNAATAEASNNSVKKVQLKIGDKTILRVDPAAILTASLSAIKEAIGEAIAAYRNHIHNEDASRHHGPEGLARVTLLESACQPIGEPADLIVALGACFHPQTGRQAGSNSHSFVAFLMNALKTRDVSAIPLTLPVLNFDLDYTQKGSEEARAARQAFLTAIPKLGMPPSSLSTNSLNSYGSRATSVNANGVVSPSVTPVKQN